MQVCHCRAVTDRRIVEEIHAGATSLDEVGLGCGAGTQCGGCHPTIEAILVTVRAAASAEQPAA